VCDETEKCVVEHHEAHDVPRVYALRDSGRLWFFDFCNPHDWRGSHWGVSDEVGMRGVGGRVVREEVTGSERCIAVTGSSLDELRAVFAARLAFRLSHCEEKFDGDVLVRRPKESDDGIIFEPMADWSPGLPPEAVGTQSDDGIHLEPRSLASLERVILNLAIVESIVVSLRSGATFEFPLDENRLYFIGDDPFMKKHIDEIACDLHLEHVENTESIRKHRPGLVERLFPRY